MQEAETIGGRVGVTFDGGVAEVRLDRPEKLNALDPAMFEALIEAGERLGRRKDLRAVVLHGAGRGFSAGLDMQTFASMALGRRDGLLADLTKRTHGAANAPQRAALVWRDLPVPVIAAIHGVALGGGFQIALGADLRYVAPDARLSILEIKWGLVPDMGGAALMRELARADVVRELAFTGREFSGADAAAYGFATAVLDAPDAETAGLAPTAAEAPSADEEARDLFSVFVELAAVRNEARAQARIVKEALDQFRVFLGGPKRRLFALFIAIETLVFTMR